MPATVKIKDNFFDRKAVIDAIGEAQAKVYAKAGAFIRQDARNSMKEAPDIRQARYERTRTKQGKTVKKRPLILAPLQKHSKPGEPPFARQGDLRKNVFFSLDRQTDTVVVGPLGFNRSSVPEVLEKGGPMTVSVAVRKVEGRPTKRVRRQVQISARPYMSPALAKNLPLLPEMWRGQVSKG